MSDASTFGSNRAGKRVPADAGTRGSNRKKLGKRLSSPATAEGEADTPAKTKKSKKQPS